MVHRLIVCSLGRREIDDRDHYGNKRVNLAGPLISELFRQLFAKVAKNARLHLQRTINAGRDINIAQAVNHKTIQRGLEYSLATGNWGAQKSNSPVASGVSQVLNRLTFASTLSHLRRLNTPVGREGKNAKPRQLHNTHWGMICPAETPEGQACGLVKNLALMTHISVGSPSRPVLEFLESWGTENLEEIAPQLIPEATKVLVNGVWVGLHRNGQELVSTLRALRRRGDMSLELSVILDIRDMEVRLYTDPGRCMRPLFIVEDKFLKITKGDVLKLKNRKRTGFTWNSLIKDGFVRASRWLCAMVVMWCVWVGVVRLLLLATRMKLHQVHPALTRSTIAYSA